MGGEVRYYSVDEAARLLQLAPERVREMAADGRLDSLPPGATEAGDWKVLLQVARSPEQPLSSEHAEHADETPDAPDEPSEIDPAPMRDEAATQTPDVPTEDPDSPPAVTEVAPKVARQPDEESRGEDAANNREPTSESGWVTTQQAARALGISARTVRWHIERGNLEAKPEGEGVERKWSVSVDSLHALRDTRQRQQQSPRDYRPPVAYADTAAADPGSAIRELADRLVEEARRAEAARVRLELSESAQSTLEVELSEERRRREAAERERDAARRELEALHETREEAPQPPPGHGPTAASPPAESGVRGPATLEPERAKPRSSTPDPQKATQRRSLWRRVFGG